MPEYHLDQSGAVAATTFDDLDAFTQGYVTAMFWLSCSCIPMSEFHSAESQHAIREGQADGTIPNDAGFSDLHPDSLAIIIADCAAFQTANAELLAQAYDRPDYTEERAGHDYWLTRNGHGAGFWDRSELDQGGLGDQLSAACDGEVDVYFGDPNPASPTGYGYVYTH